jgi:hypothetical protein
VSTYESLTQIRERQQAEADAITKAASDPAALDDADMKHLDPAKIRELMDSGQLRHLGIGPRRTGRRH